MIVMDSCMARRLFIELYKITECIVLITFEKQELTTRVDCKSIQVRGSTAALQPEDASLSLDGNTLRLSILSCHSTLAHLKLLRGQA